MNKRIVFLLLAFLAFANINAQILKPVKWTSKVEKTGDNEFNLVMEGKIDEGWHMYSQFTPADGPLPAEFKFAEAKGNYELIGKVKESPYKKHFNEDFGVDEYYFEGKVTFTQKVKVTNAKLKTIKGAIEYQVCKNVCIGGDNNFTFSLPELTVVPAEKAVTTNVPTPTNVPTNNVDTAKVEVSAVDTTKAVTQEVKAVAEKQEVPAPKKEEKKGLLMIFFLAFLGGFAALMTPCVFPMIPMTVSFFTKQSKNPAQGRRNAIFYGISIILIYVILGLAITAIFGADALNALSTNPWFNIIFFFLLVFFAASFLGAFEIMLPNSWANKVDRQADRGGMIGILFMALALAIVSFSCTGPIVGTLLVESASKGGIAPIVGMLGFSSALALPFMLFAMFPGWLNSLPKSGGWLNTVKVSLGFLELALAFKFLSNADLVLQLHLLEREAFLVIWIAIFGTWAFYLFGKITTPHDSPTTHISVGRLTLGMLVLAFTLYMIPGIFGAPLKLISAFPPPQEYSESPKGFFGTSAGAGIAAKALPAGAEEGPHGLAVFHDYDKGLAYAKQVNKPILLDFTGRACVNCRKMENNVWSDDKVLNILNNDVVLVSLYVDEKIELPKNEQFVTKAGDEIITVGDKWTDFMITRYNTNTQPLYALEDLNGKNLNEETPTTSYDPDVQKYADWLKKGIANFKKS